MLENNKGGQGLQASDHSSMKQRQFYNVPPEFPDSKIYLAELGVFFALAVVAALTGNVWLFTASVGALVYLTKHRRE